MKVDYYQVLGLNSSATAEEIRRAYRILARRYHPDVNPGKKSEERFRLIAEAYGVLGDAARRKQYDTEYVGPVGGKGIYDRRGAFSQGDPNSARKRFYKAKFENFGKVAPIEDDDDTRSTPPPPPPPRQPELKSNFKEAATAFKKVMKLMGEQWQKVRQEERVERSTEQPRSPSSKDRSVAKVSFLEVSITLPDAVRGVKKTVEISEADGSYKVSISIPPGVRNGSVLRMKPQSGINEELVFIIRVAQHPFLTLLTRGLVAELPVSISEALLGAQLNVPTLDGVVQLQIPPGSQSGTEIRVKGKGVTTIDGTRGDLFFRLLVHIPTCHQAVGIKQRGAELEQYYEAPIRQGYPTQHLLEQAA